MASIIDQIMELEAKKQELLGRAKDEALKAAEKAIADLNNLGFNYRLVEGGASMASSSAKSDGATRTRRTGVADEVLAMVKNSQNGMTRGELIDQMGADDKAAQQSISNALSNLKKKGLLIAEDGTYRPA